MRTAWLAGVGLLISAWTTNAEAEWILWQRTMLTDRPGIETAYRPVTAAATGSDCQRGAEAVTQLHAARLGGRVTGPTVFRYTIRLSDGLHEAAWIYECWPASFDPRLAR